MPYDNAPDMRAVHAHEAVPLPDDRAGQQERQAEGGVPGGVGQPHQELWPRGVWPPTCQLAEGKPEDF